MIKILLLISLTALLSSNSFSQTSFWTKTNGPFAGTVHDYSFGEINIVYAGTDSGVYKSTDNGMNWNSLGLPGNSISAICRHSSGAILARGSNGYVFRSVDEGLNWAEVNSISFIQDMKEIRGGSIIAATANSIYKSTNSGLNWTFSHSITQGNCIDTSSNNEMYISSNQGTLYKSTNDGNTWFALNGVFLPGMTSVSVGINGYVYLTRWNGELYRSTDAGISFMQINHPIYKTTAAVTTNDGYLYCGTFYQGIWSSSDYGDTWVKQYTGERTNFFVNNLCRGNNGNVFASVFGNGVIRTTDHGDHWFGFRFRNSHRIVDKLLQSWDKVFSNTGQISLDGGINWMYADFEFLPTSYARNELNGYIFATNGSTHDWAKITGIYRSTDNGISWDLIDLDRFGLWFQFVYVARNGNVYTGNSEVILKSTDNGEYWIAIPSLPFYNFAVNDSGHIFGKKFQGVYRSTNNGIQWDLVLPLNSNALPIYITNENEIYTGGYNTLFKSSNNGNNWIQENITGTVTSTVENQSGRMFISLYGVGVYMKVGDTWTDVSHDLGNRNVNALCFNLSGQLLAGTNSGVYKTNASVVSVNNTGSQLPEGFTLYQNYPNPFNPVTIINYQLSLPDGKAGMFSNVKLSVFDVIGREVGMLVDETQNAGSYSVTFNAGHLPSGIYFYKLFINGKSIDTKRMVLLK